MIKSPQSSPSASNKIPDTNRSVYYASGTDDNCVFLNVVPVKVIANDHEVHTYAFLDQGSTTTLCHETLFDQLGIKGEKNTVNLTTLSEKAVSHKSNRTCLTIAGLDGGNTVDLKEVYTVSSLPVQPNKSLTASQFKSWPHLEGFCIPKVSFSVGLLIGVDNPELFWTMEERRGQQGQPYADRTILGWRRVWNGST